MLAYIHTANGVSLILNGRSYSIAKDHPNYDEIISELGYGDAADLEKLAELVKPPIVHLQQALVGASLTDRVTVDDHAVYFDGKPVHNTLTFRMLDLLKDERKDVTPMARFLENLMQNPSYRAVQGLYSFLEKGGIPLTTDGHFLAYKYVREDYFDCYSGTFDNSVGKIVEMPRNQVDENPERTCSHGLHVCSYEYLPKTTGGSRVVICKINPADVVAIPTDYNDTKMRVCRYEVVGEVEGYGERPAENVLAQRSLFDDYDRSDDDEDEIDDGTDYDEPLEENYVVELYRCQQDYEEGIKFLSATYGLLESAEERAELSLDDITPISVVRAKDGEYFRVFRV